MSNDNDNVRREIESLKEIVEANMRTMKAENGEALAKNEAAIDRLQASNDRLQASNEKAIGDLRTTIEKNSRTLLVEIAVVVGVGVAITSLIVSFIVK